MEIETDIILHVVWCDNRMQRTEITVQDFIKRFIIFQCIRCYKNAATFTTALVCVCAAHIILMKRDIFNGVIYQQHVRT